MEPWLAGLIVLSLCCSTMEEHIEVWLGGESSTKPPSVFLMTVQKLIDSSLLRTVALFIKKCKVMEIVIKLGLGSISK